MDEHEAWEAWKAQTRRKRRMTKSPLCPMSRYTDLLYSETIEWKDTRSGETKASKSTWEFLREQAENKLEYWISLGGHQPVIALYSTCQKGHRQTVRDLR